MKNDLSDNTLLPLVEQARRENGGVALEQLWEAVQPFVNMLMPRRLEGYDYEDLSQLAYAGVWVAVQNFNPTGGSSFRTYLYQAVKIAFADEQRRLMKKKRQHAPVAFIDNVAEPPSHQRTPCEEAADKDEAQAFVALVKAALSPDDFNLVRRHFMEGETRFELADAYGVDEQAMRGRIEALRIKLKKIGKQLKE